MFRKPWYISQTAYWLFSLCLLSWPYRIFINMNTGLLNYQIIKLFGNNSPNSDTGNADSNTLNEERSNFTSNDDLLDGNNCSLPPSYSQAMLWPPTYNYIKRLLYEQTDSMLENQLDNNENVNYVLDRIDKYHQQTNQQNNQFEQQQLNMMNKLSVSSDNQQSNQLKHTRIPSSLSCSFLNGQIVYLVNTLKNPVTATLNSSIENNNLNCGTSLDVKGTTTVDSPILMNKNSRVQIIGAGSLHETENLSLNIDDLNHTLIVDENESNLNDLNVLKNSSSYQNSSIPRSFTSENFSYLKRFSIRILRRIKSMQNLNEKPDVNV